tara:strand:+ start:335 stop:1177 length:843 start_codon:yes stop_codon:yes gene_type:complete
MKLYSLFFLLLFSETTHGQNTFNYLGTIILNNNTAMSFQLNLIEKDGIVNGYSITNIGMKDETKSEITGLYFKSDQSFQIQETQILQTNSEAPLNTFCYLNMNLSFEGRFKRKRLNGTFTGNFLDNTECANGKIIMMEEEKLKKKIKKIEKKIEKKYTEKLDSTNILQQTITLKEGDDFSIKWKNKKVTLFIWDANKEDGDRIRLKINSKVILDNFETKNKRKKIKLKLQEGENIIEIKALNIGSSPPNTSRIELVDSKTKYPIMTQLEIGKSAQIKIIK